ncbi:glutamine synthetase family protein [Oharaeibacter diazotrophicus]|uniref:Glutamate--putrescine ligase n=1 Tax=Oharaeibacter diazotrophicus TaxID=1920512 RepID=A0A4R6RDP4_9HYPH|nr:glutamine synthetase family protein [Oharaeibacter diazotrophicus]TDP84333.1 glutamate--putrescine ligase [Oharaeibacter diazotrophicus]BBE73370.1 gamma-glutamylputrescine synthetase PuuA [Pleomorphomonas sp. SM30]GLS75162.1 glutamine synthetase [Oharaeibacter diazotrophicus]
MSAVTLAEVAEAEAFLAANPDVVQVECFLTDPSGVQRGKVLRRSEVLGAYRNGRPLPCSILSLDIRGADVEETGLVWDEGDSDRVCRPVAGSLTRAPWRTTPTAQFLLTSYETDGRPSEADPRHALARVVEACHAAGYHPVAAVETEFYLVDGRAAAEGRLTPPAAPNGFRPTDLQAYLVQDLADFSAFLDDVYAAADAAGLPARTLISEYSPGQLEIVLEHRTDPLRAADDAILWKRLVKGVAERHGHLATFMAKPYADFSGSGTHLHVSFADAEGRNLFAGAEPAGNALLRAAVAGLEATMAESMALFAPNANSYRRFKPNSYAPVGPAWAIDNRSVPIRVTAGPPHTRHLEQRVCGADANPYVALAAVLAGMLEGVEKGLAPSEPITGNGYAQIPPSLPRHWPDALRRARASDFLKRRLGERFVDVFLTIKEAECDRFFAEVSDRDLAWYLRLA